MLRACDLYGTCGPGAVCGIDYPTRFGISDEEAIVYVLEGGGACLNFQDCSQHDSAFRFTTNSAALARLRAQFAAGRPLEPMVLWAAAGQCLHMNLRNHLPDLLDHGPNADADGKPQEVPEAHAYLNFLPMITDGFNINQFRMSLLVGLSAAQVGASAPGGRVERGAERGRHAAGGVGRPPLPMRDVSRERCCPLAPATAAATGRTKAAARPA